MTRWSIVCTVIVAAASARAGGLAWHAPSGCPDDAAVRQAIERRLDASVDTVALAVDVEITRGDDGFVAQVRVTGTAERRLTSTSCDELTDAVAVVVARLATDARKATPPAEVIVAPPAQRRSPPAPTSHRSPWNTGLRTSAIVGIGNVPELGGAGELAVWLAWREAFVELGGIRWLSSTARIGDTTSGVAVDLVAIALRGGWQFGVVRAWIGAELGRLRGTGVGLTSPHSGSGPWLAVGGGFGAAWRFAAHVRGLVGLDLEIVMNRVEFALDSGGLLYRSPRVAVRGAVGIELGWR